MRRGGVWILAVAGAALLLQGAPAGAQNVRVGGVDSLHVRLNVQPLFDTTTVDGEPSSEWSVRRARVGVRAWAAGFIRGEVEVDVGRGDARLTDATVRFSFDDLRLQAGQFKRPFGALELVSSRELPVIERDGAPRGTAGPTPNGLVTDLGHAGRDIGATAAMALGRGEVLLGAFNGEGANDAESDDGKQVVARVGVELGEGWLGGGWAVAGAWSARRETRPIDGILPETVSGEGVWRNAFELAAARGEYAEPGWKALVQGMAGDNEQPALGGSRDAGFLALQGIVAWHAPIYTVPYVIGVEPVGRIGWTDPNDEIDDDEATLWTAGVNVYHHARVKTQVGVDVLSPAEGDAETAFRVMSVIGF